jgi:ABC-type maltose transport system permease subunit
MRQDDTYIGLIFTYASFCPSYTILMITGYYNIIAQELDEAASVEGSAVGRATTHHQPVGIPVRMAEMRTVQPHHCAVPASL